jgi:general secretion pathway protein E
MAQRLVRTLCPHCKSPTTIDAQTWNTLTQPLLSNAPTTAYKTVGCLECRATGYYGRMGVYEVMVMSDAIKSLVTDSCDIDTLRKQAIKEGMHSLRLSGAQIIASGVTTVEEVLRVTPSGYIN